MFSFARHKTTMVDPRDALVVRAGQMVVVERHFINFHSLKPPFPEGFERAVFGLGCFWGAERCFWSVQGVWTTAAGYAGGYSPNPAPQAPASTPPCRKRRPPGGSKASRRPGRRPLIWLRQPRCRRGRPLRSGRTPPTPTRNRRHRRRSSASALPRSPVDLLRARHGVRWRMSGRYTEVVRAP